MKKKDLKEICIQLYLKGKNYSQISKELNMSRTYVSMLIKDDERIIDKQNTKKMKVYKRKNDKRLSIFIPPKFIKEIGITEDLKIDEYVDISIDKEGKKIIIEKHSK